MPKVKSNQKKYLKGYDEDLIQKALTEVKTGVPKKTVAKKYGIPRSTIQFRLSDKFKKPRHGPCTFLTSEEEDILETWLIESHKKGFPRRMSDVQASVKEFFVKNQRKNPFKDSVPGKHWYQSFLQRHPCLTKRVPEAVTNASSTVAEIDIRNWFQQIETYLKEKNYFDILKDPSRVYNGDETAFQLCPKGDKVIAVKGSRNVYEIDQGTAKANITVMFTFSASGETTPPMIIYPYKRVPPHIATTVPGEWGIGVSDNGWMKSEIFFEYISNIFHPYLKRNNITLPIILFVDGHKTHLTYELSQLCTRLKIILVSLYPNSTRILQPADVACFKPLKSLWKSGVLKWRRENPFCQLTKVHFAPVLKEVLSGIDRNSVINGFRACGLCPWYVDLIDFSKCLGKNGGKLHTENSSKDLSKPNLNYEAFVRIVGEEKVAQLENVTDAALELDEDGRCLYNLLKYFHLPHEMESIHANTAEVDKIQNEVENTVMISEISHDIAIDHVSEARIGDDLDIEVTAQRSTLIGGTSESTVQSFTNEDILKMPVFIYDQNHEDEQVVHNFIIEETDQQFTVEIDMSHATTKAAGILNVDTYDKDDRTDQPEINIGTEETCQLLSTVSTEISAESSQEKNMSCLPDNETDMSLRECLLWPKTPQRTGKRQSERMPYVITSTHFKKIHEEKEKQKADKEKQKAEKKAIKAENARKKFEKIKQTKSKEKKQSQIKVEEKDNPKIYIEENINIMPQNSSILHDRLDDNILCSGGCSRPAKTGNATHVRNLFQDKAQEITKASENILIDRGLCFICVKTIYKTNIGIKCHYCNRTYHKSCLVRKEIYKEFFICSTCLLQLKDA